MQVGFSVALLVLVLLFYLSNPKNNVNKWCAISGFFFWFGAAKEAAMYEIIPVLSSTLGITGLEEAFIPFHSVCTWVIYSLAMPSIAIAGFYIACMDKNEYFQTQPKRFLLLKLSMYVPGVILLFFFTPWHFGVYQWTSQSFWIIYTIYNFGFAGVLTLMAIKGIRIERNSRSTNQNNQRKRVALTLLPPLYYWLFSVFGVYLLDAFLITSLEEYHMLWQANLFIVLICIFVFILFAFKGGFMGLRLVSHNHYDWNTDMRLVNASSAHSKHFLKSRVPLMEMYVEDIKEHITNLDSSKPPPVEIDELSDSIVSLKSYFDRIVLHSQFVVLEDEEYYPLKDLLAKALATSLHGYPRINTQVKTRENVFLYCDGSHMTEVFVNIIKNAAESISDEGKIEVLDTEDRSMYYLMFKDDGAGISPDMLEKIFTPYESTKNQGKNSGLGLSYCKSVSEKHGGHISAESRVGVGTTITIALPRKRVKKEPKGLHPGFTMVGPP